MEIGIGYWQHFHIGNISLKKGLHIRGDFSRIKAFPNWDESHLLAEKVGKMPYEVLEKEMEKLDEAQKNAVVLFVRFLVSQTTTIPALRGRAARQSDSSWDAFDRIRAKAAIDHKDHEWTMDEIDAEIAAARRERRQKRAKA